MTCRQKDCSHCRNLRIFHIGTTSSIFTAPFLHIRSMGSTWGQLKPTRPNLGPTWTHLPPTSPQLGPNMAQLSLPPSWTCLRTISAQVELHMGPRRGHSWPNMKSSRSAFSLVFSASMQLHVEQCSFVVSTLGPPWGKAATKRLSSAMFG